MKNQVLTIDNFDNNNLNEVIDYFTKDNVLTKFKIREMDNKDPAPDFHFTSRTELEDGYYDFMIDNVQFMNCFLYKRLIHEDGITYTYSTGSYYVHINCLFTDGWITTVLKN